MSKVCIAKILTAHGVRGLVKVDCFLEDPNDLKNYNPLTAADGRKFTIHLKNSIKGKYLAEIEGIADRNEAEKYRNIELFVERDQMPTPDDGFYHEDLIGCDVLGQEGQKLGTLLSIENYGAGDLFNIKPVTGKTFLLPHTETYVPSIDAEHNTITIANYEEWRDL